MRYSARQLNRATLDRQLLLKRRRMSVADAVARILAIQAQAPASPYVALWNRVAGFDPAQLDAAFAARDVVKSTLMRMTLHAVHSDDWPGLQGAMAARLRQRVFDKRFAGTGLTIDDVDALLEPLAEFTADARTNADIDRHLRSLTGDTGELGAWWALRAYAPVHHAPTGGPWSFGQRPSYRHTHVPTAPGDEGVRHYLLRYLQAFGPASVADAQQFSRLTVTPLRRALDELGDAVEAHEGPSGPVWDVAGATVPVAGTVAPPRLMAMWDSIYFAYADRTRTIPEPYRRYVIRQNGDCLPTLLVDGQAAGVWRVVDDAVEATAFHELPDDTWAALATEADGLLALLRARDARAYGRYDFWWSDLPVDEVRRLPG
ncbi:winged helix DNA-binding domain-containing protein [Jatrophihabitans fulvus]